MLNLNLNTTSSNLGEVVRPPWNGPADAIAGTTFFYSADYAEDFYDLSGNGNHGVITDAGDGSGSITHQTTNGPRWEFRATGTGTTYVQTPAKPTAHSTTEQYGYFALFRKTRNDRYQYILNSNDGTGRYQLFVNDSNQYVYARNYGSSNIQINSGTNFGTTNYKFYNYQYLGNISTTEHRFKANNVLRDSNATAISTTNEGEFIVGYQGLVLNNANSFDLVCIGYKDNYHLTDANVTQLINYYNSIYSYPGI